MSTSDLSFRDLAVPYFENVFIDLETVLKKYGLTSYLIGASAIAIQLLRDGIKPSRGTKDIDFAVMIDSKKEYDKIANELQGKGYNKVRAPWTFYNPEYNVVLDLLPFGEIEEEFTEDFSQRKTSLHFLGFTEILKDSESIAISGQSINVPSLPGMVILKLIAWNDRPEERDKDLYDILKVIENYFEWDQEDILENHFDLFDENDFDPLMIAARVLGRQAGVILRPTSELSTHIEKTFGENLIQPEDSLIAKRWASERDQDLDYAFNLLKQFQIGIEESLD